jgi:radical SAM protein with 4Fe4S-binding SPASM domain
MSEPSTHDNGAALAADRFASLPDDTVLFVSPSYGFLRHPVSGDSVFMHAEALDLLCACDGTRRVRDLLEERLLVAPAARDRLARAVVELVDLARRDMLLLHEQPRHAPPAITGSREAYYPLNLQIELTAACNLRCFYCYREAGAHGAPERLATGELLDILDVLHGHGLQSVELTGGEPMVHEDFARILRFCGERFALVALLTNGVCLTKARVESMLPFRRKMVVGVSLDGSTAETHDRRRGVPGAFARTTAGLRRLAEHGFLTRVSMVVDEENWDDVERTLLLARELGASLFTYTPLLPIGRGAAHFRLWEEHDPAAMVQREKELRARYKGFVHVVSEESIFTLQESGGCGAGYRNYAMDPVGNVRPCVTFDPHVAVHGSLRTDSPHEVFGGPLAYAFAQVIPPDPVQCAPCPYRVFCQRCLVRGLIGSTWLEEGACTWLHDPASARWRALVQAHTLAARG